MVQLTRIYTRGGDKGKTSLGDGSRVKKYDLRINTIGDVDEANCHIGLAAVHCQDMPSLHTLLLRIQNELFDLGADLCVPQDMEGKLTITQAQVDALEHAIDAHNKELPPLTSFILPGGSPLAAHLHTCRAITRRAERSLCQLREENPEVNICTLTYLNRLSDLLFVLARFVNHTTQQEILWIPGQSR